MLVLHGRCRNWHSPVICAQFLFGGGGDSACIPFLLLSREYCFEHSIDCRISHSKMFDSNGLAKKVPPFGKFVADTRLSSSQPAYGVHGHPGPEYMYSMNWETCTHSPHLDSACCCAPANLSFEPRPVQPPASIWTALFLFYPKFVQRPQGVADCTPRECHARSAHAVHTQCARSAKFWMSANTRTLLLAPFDKFLVPYWVFF